MTCQEARYKMQHVRLPDVPDAEARDVFLHIHECPWCNEWAHAESEKQGIAHGKPREGKENA